ncbi:hypothetical protein C1I98_09595 [Spongiactinospora gelatinilytica]|uniref:Uncharacterized protein n=1 Tax=Spongiactinospora gelatinilytica TaxID=2666298 RepID=A0A2W2HYF3_9ACTN|nr:hypothetical protein [Spongiactinospora gelatinilytica]PZG50967.1 hypothetical protein C1I98_09595 [Spongiactinospora gelatinilytica]
MRPIALWAHEVRRAGLPALLGPLVLVAAMLLLAALGTRIGSAQENTRWFLMGAAEMGLPLLTGIAAATLTGRDRAAELRLTCPSAYRVAVARRVAVVMCWAAVCAAGCSVLLMATGWWDPAFTGPDGQLVWLAPAVWTTALGACSAAMSRSVPAATTLVGFLWTFQQIFAEFLVEDRVLRHVFLFATTRGPVPDWPANRLTLLATALPMGLAAWVLLGRPERILRGAAE